METLGSLVDRLDTVNLKMWWAQENLYQVRHMSFEEFKSEFGTDEGLKRIWEYFKKATDLNIQRNNLIDDLDNFIGKIVKVLRPDLDPIELGLVQNKFKSY